MDDKSDPSLIEQFVNITGAPESRARALLNACNGNLEMAIGMHLEEPQLSGNQTQGESTSHVCVGDDDVRAPIPQKRGVLVEGPYRVSRPRRRGNQSVFDAFRDFEAEAREQELRLSGHVGKGKRKTLKDLFKPPLDIMHKGTFDTAKVAGEQAGKWLMVNIQDSKEFKCQQLNRDVWSNESVRNILAEHFILWQVYHDSDDGDRYIQFYHVTNFPHLAVLDPRTGEKLVEWDTVDAQAFCDVAADFLSNHSLGKESNGCFPPAAKRRKRESIIDASEDSQLEAAIAASLKETSTDLSSENNELQDREDEDTPGEDSLTEFTESESESEKPVVKKDTLENNSVQNDKRTIKAVKWRKNNTQLEQSVEKTDYTCPKQKKALETAKNVERQDDIVDSKESDGEDDDVLDSGCAKAYIMLRYPNGKRKQKTFLAEATILDLIKYVQSQGFSNERYELITNFPRKNLSYMDSDLSLKDAGLFPRETLFVQERLLDNSS